MGVPLAIGLGLLFVVQACASSPTGPSETRVAPGEWGGAHVALTVTQTGARLEFDCATGEISQPLTLDSHGKLAVDGVFVRERPGAQRVGEEPEKQPARYSGKVDGDALVFEVILKESNQSIGTFTVTRGGEARVFKCR